MKVLHRFLLIFFFSNVLYLAKGQSFQIVDEKNRPVYDAAVTFSELNTQKSTIRFTDNQGFTNSSAITYPVCVQVHHMAYLDFVDTLTSASGNHLVQLKSNPVNLKTVSVTSSYAPAIAEKAVYKVDVITREQIDRQASNNLEQLLSQQLNMRIDRDQALGSSLTLQGMSGEHIKFLVDGVPVIGRKAGLIDLGQINLNNIDHIEVVKGSLSVLYGTDAAGGVINLITKNNAKDKLNGGINTYYENIGQYNIDAFAGWKFKKADVLISGGRNFFEGWNKVDTNSRYYDWKPKEQYFGNIKLTQNINRARLTFQSSYMHEKVTNKSAEVRGLPYEAYAFDEYNSTIRFNNQLYADIPLKNDLSMNVTGAYSIYEALKNTYLKNLVDLTQVLSSNPDEHDTTRFYNAMVRYTFNRAKPDAKFNYQVGFDLNNEKGTGKRIDDGAIHSIGDYAVFGSLEYTPFKAITIRPGIRYAYNTAYQSPIIPSLNILYRVNKQLTWRASYGRGFRAPNLKELYLFFHDSNHSIEGNTQLTPETSNHAESSIAWKLLTEKFLFQLEPSVFYNNVHDKIALVQQGTATADYTYINIEKFISKGAELQAHFTLKNFHLNAGINYTGIYNTYYGAIGNTDFAWSPSINGSLDYTFTKTNTTLSAFVKYNGEQPVYVLEDDNTLGRYINNDYTLIDLNIAQRLFNERLILTGGVMNLLDVINVRSYGAATAHSSSDTEAVIGMGRSLFAKIQWHF